MRPAGQLSTISNQRGNPNVGSEKYKRKGEMSHFPGGTAEGEKNLSQELVVIEKRNEKTSRANT